MVRLDRGNNNARGIGNNDDQQHLSLDVEFSIVMLFRNPGISIFRCRTEESTCVVDTRSPFSLQLIFRHRNTHKFHQYNQYAKLKNHSVGRCVTIFSEGREIIASSARSNERRQAPGPSVNFNLDIADTRAKIQVYRDAGVISDGSSVLGMLE